LAGFRAEPCPSPVAGARRLDHPVWRGRGERNKIAIPRNGIPMKLSRTTVFALFVGVILAALHANAAVPVYTAVIDKTYPHDPDAFTEGLLYHQGFLYESTGRTGHSFIRQVDLNTGAVIRQVAIDPAYFGEGIDIWNDRLIELTWKNQIGFIYDVKTFKLLSNFHYPGEGWALTNDNSHLIMSDGTSDIRLLDPDTLTETGRIHVTCNGHDVHRINELEWVKGEIYANIWVTNLIVRIDPATGAVVGIIDLTDVTQATVVVTGDNVLNGIAYDAAGDRLFVTGKLWPKLYQISLTRRADDRDFCQFLP
jgi:glutamine cyclotransferase